MKSGMEEKIIGVLIVILVFGALFPVILSQMTALGNNANASSTVKVFLTLMPLFIAIGVALGVISYMRGNKR